MQANLKQLIVNNDNDGLKKLIDSCEITPMDLVKAGAELAYVSEDDEIGCNERVTEESDNQKFNHLGDFSQFGKVMGQFGDMFSGMFGQLANTVMEDPSRLGLSKDFNKNFQEILTKNINEIMDPVKEKEADTKQTCDNPNCNCETCTCDPCLCNELDESYTSSNVIPE